MKTVDYTFGHDEISQTVVTYNSAGAESSRDKQWFLHDGKANVRGLLNAAAAILTIAGTYQIYFYDAYGNLLNMQASQAATTLLYNGEMFDALTGNQYLRARYYNPANAQFNRLDPFFGNHQDPQSFNRYAYVHGDPVAGSDPTGMVLFDDLSVAGIVSHTAFGELVKLVRPTAETGIQLGSLFSNLKNTIYGLLKPDVVDSKFKDYFELKPVTHKYRPDLQLIDAAQMGTYDFVLGIGLGYARGDSVGLLSSFPVGTYAPIVITAPDGIYSLKFWPADDPMSGGHCGQGFVWYKLSKIVKPPRRFVEPVRVVQRVYDSKPVEIEVWDPYYTPLFNANLQIDSTLVLGVAAIGVGVGSIIAMASFVTSMPSLSFR